MDRSFTTALLGFVIIAAALAVQFMGWMNGDNGWLLHVAERVVAGEKLGRQVIESNPPLIIYIMEIPVLMGNLLHVNPIYMFAIFIALLGLASLLLAFFTLENKAMQVPLIFALFFLPGISFGEREHIFIILILPYFVSLWSGRKYPWWFVIIAGLMAGIGIALKPFFVMVWAVLVLVKMAMDRRFFSFFNLQNIVIGVVIAGYVAYLMLFEKVYVNEVFPLLVRYYGGFNGKVSEVYKQSLQLAILCQIAFWIVFIKDRKLLTRPIYFANFANLAGVLLIILQSKTWINYFYPPNFFGFISNSLLTIVLFDNLRPLWNKVASFISSFILMIFVTLAISTSMKISLRINEEDNQNMVELLNKYAAGKNVYMLTFNLGTMFPAVLYTHAEYHGRYAHFWSLPGMYEGGEIKDEELVYHQPGQRLDDETRLIAQVIGDIERYPPEIIVVMDSKYYSRSIGNYKFDFIKYFSIEPEFAEIWTHYKKVKKIGDYDIYQYQH